MARQSPVGRFDIYLVDLDPTIGAEIRKTRPCLVISPDEMHRHVRTVIIAPMTSAVRKYPTRVPIRFRRRQGEVALDQLRAVDQSRLVRRLGTANRSAAAQVSARLVEMFAP
ncbi:MAG TPA: type II toxin-antitoxin system PemK/MazF family toxin [Stellaceae bacterium]|jgi:mRNA interferase MazF|nr:type II toxin-antitoxin system PemK/MazF family toxin [Stellaceae bacterium]